MPRTPLPVLVVATAALCQYANQISIYVIFPMIPSILRHFYPETPSKYLGYRAGWLGSMYAMGNLCGSLAWGRISDTIGRRASLIIGMLATTLFVALFGLSANFASALAFRFLWGLGNGNVGIVKTVLSEVTDSSNQARGFSFIGVGSGLGRLLGPLIAAFLVDPATQYPTFRGNAFFEKFPFFLPCVVAAAICGVTLVFCILFLRETLASVIPFHDWPRRVGIFCCGRFYMHRRPLVDEPPSAESSRAVWAGTPGDRRVLVTTGVYGLIALGASMCEELLPIWVVNSPTLHGFAFSTRDLGFIYMVCAPVQLSYQLLVYPRLALRYGERVLLSRALLVASLCVAVFPAASLAASSPNLGVKVASLSVVYAPYVCGTQTALTATFTLVSNSAPKIKRGTANGIGQTIAALARMIGPPLASNIFAASINSIWLPSSFGFMIAFFLAALLLFAASYVSVTRLTDAINRKPEETAIVEIPLNNDR